MFQWRMVVIRRLAAVDGDVARASTHTHLCGEGPPEYLVSSAGLGVIALRFDAGDRYTDHRRKFFSTSRSR
jgi:hypothetical protein